jgi:hypothetical protein
MSIRFLCNCLSHPYWNNEVRDQNWSWEKSCCGSRELALVSEKLGKMHSWQNTKSSCYYSVRGLHCGFADVIKLSKLRDNICPVVNAMSMAGAGIRTLNKFVQWGYILTHWEDAYLQLIDHKASLLRPWETMIRVVHEISYTLAEKRSGRSMKKKPRHADWTPYHVTMFPWTYCHFHEHIVKNSSPMNPCKRRFVTLTNLIHWDD